MGGLGFQTTGQSCPMILAFGGAISESAPRERQGELEAQIPGMQLPRGCALGGLCTQAAALPAVDEVGDRVVLAERGRIQVHADRSTSCFLPGLKLCTTFFPASP